MKRKNKSILITGLVIFAIIAIWFLVNNINTNSNDNNINTNVSVYQEDSTLSESSTDIQDEETTTKTETYTDSNPVKIGIYIQKGNTKSLITNEYSCNWDPEEIMGLFYVVPTLDPTLPNSSFSELWKSYINEYPNSNSYRIGYNIKFTLNTGEVIDRTILNPDNAYYMFPKIMVFLYDDVNLIPGKRYYHITNDEMNDKTICSSVKLVGDVETQNIISPIELTAFCFDSKDDFDENTNKYRGNSFYTITINRK